MKKLLITICIILGTISISTSSSIVAQSKSAYKIPDTPEAKEIMRVIENAYDIEVEAGFTFDIKKFPEVFINDPRFPLDPATLETVKELTNNPSLETAGYLDYKIAFYSWRMDATINAEKTKEKAKSENRDLTPEEKRSLVDQNGRIAPARSQSPIRSLPLTFLSVEVNDDIATVVVNDGPRTIELFLVLVDKKWYIAGTKGVAFHP